MMARRSHTMMPTLLLLVCLAGAAPRAARACLGTPVVTSGSFATAQPIDTAKALSLDGVKQVLEHFAPIGDYRPNTKSTFSCVDSRGNDEELVRAAAPPFGGGGGRAAQGSEGGGTWS